MSKKSFLTLVALLIGNVVCFAQDTFSICAIDTMTREVGSAGASCIGAPQIPNGCILISDIHPNVGVIHSQASYIATNQTYAKNLMNQGLLPQQIIDSLIENDVQNTPNIRQYGIVAFDTITGAPISTAYTGNQCMSYANHITGRNYAIQGNILLGQAILDSMEVRFLRAEGSLACKLMYALQGANVPGADTRCLSAGISSKSSFLRVARASDAPNNPSININVSKVNPNTDPIDSLQTLFNTTVTCLSKVRNPIDYVLQSVSIYPNPTAGNIIVSSNVGTIREIKIINILGMNVLNFTNINNNSIQLDVTTLPQGIYYARVKTNFGQKNIKFIKI